VAVELERAQKGTLVLLPRGEFESKVQRAAAANSQILSPPRLVKARYTARLMSQALFGGAEWSVVNSASGPGLMAITDFNVALTKKILVDGGDGLLFDAGGKSSSLWIEKLGESTVHFDWGRRGLEMPDGLHFDLELPACANAWMELTLPADCRVSTDKPGVLVEGPRPAAEPDARTWLLGFAGRSRLEFAIRRLQAGPSLLIASVQSRQELSPDRILADYDLQIEALGGAVHELVLDGDSFLQPYEVLLGGVPVKDWQWLPPKVNKLGGGVLLVPLAEPLQGKLPLLRVRALAATLSPGKSHSWESPALRLRGALSDGESLQLRILPEVQLESWKPEHFHIDASSVEPDGALLLKLVHGGANVPRPPASMTEPGQAAALAIAASVKLGLPRRPSAVLHGRTTQFLLQQKTLWQIEPAGSSLQSELVCKPNQGQLYHLALKLPADSQVEELTGEPRESLRGWATAGTPANPLLLIDLARATGPLAPVKIVARLRLPPGPAAQKGEATVAFPDIVPLAPCLREGVLAIAVHPRWQSEVVKSSWPAAATTEAEGPWKQSVPDYYFAFHGTPVSGSLRLRPRAPRFQARAQSDAFLGGAHGTVVTRLTLEPTNGSLDHVDLVVSAPLAGAWIGRSETAGVRIAEIKRLANLSPTGALLAVGPRFALDVLSLLATQPGRELWRVRFAEPLRGRATLNLEAPFDPIDGPINGKSSPERQWQVPLVMLANVAAFDGELAVQPVGAEITWANAEQIQELPRAPAKTKLAGSLRQVRQFYRYGGQLSERQAPSLIVRTKTAPAQGPALETCDSASLTSCAEPGSPTLHLFHFRLIGWHKRTVQVLLPAEARVIAAKTQGRWIGLAKQDHADAQEIVLPASVGVSIQDFDLYYETAGILSRWAPWETLPASPPQLPLRPLDFRRDWLLPKGMVPLDKGWQSVDPSADSPGDDAPPGWIARAWHVGQPLMESLWGEPDNSDWASAEKQFLATLPDRLQRRLGPPTTWVLGAVLESIAGDFSAASPALVVDATALAAAGLSPATTFAGGSESARGDPWNRLNLVLLSTPNGLLLTTAPQASAWTAGSNAIAQGPLAGAVAPAAQRGHDATGRFVGALDWIAADSTIDSLPTAALSLTRDFWLPANLDPGWTRWRAPAGIELRPEMTVGRTAAFHWMGGLAGAGLAIVWFAWASRMRSPKWQPWRIRVLLIWLGIAALAVPWLNGPPRFLAFWPAATAALLAAGSWLFALIRPVPTVAKAAPSFVRLSGAVITFLIATGFTATLLPSAFCQGTDASLVLILPGPVDAPDKQDVLVAPELLKKLDALIQRGPGNLRGAFLTDAAYDGSVTGDGAEFNAEFHFHSFGDATVLSVPLVGVELAEGALLDGAPVWPVAAHGGYEVAVKEKGPHRLTLKFGIRLQSTDEHRDLQFAVPRLYRSKLSLQQPIAWPAPRVLSGYGPSDIAPVESVGQRLSVELGHDATVHLRWPPQNSAAHRPKTTVREAYYWDLRAPGAGCSAVLTYNVTGGSSTGFAVALPENLEPRKVEVIGDGDETGRPHLKSWRVVPENGEWHLQVRLQAPASGNVVIKLQMLLRQPPGPPSVRLALPMPLDVHHLGGSIAYRVDPFDTGDKGFKLQLQPLAIAQFAKEWQAAGASGGLLPTRAWSFATRQPDSALVLSLVPRRPSFEQDLRWTLHPDRADLAASLKATSSGDDIVLIEWDAPQQVTVAEISGENVRAWTRAPGENRIQIWCKQPAHAVSVEVRGWMVMPSVAGGKSLRWKVPLLRCPDAGLTRTVLRVIEGVGLRAEPDLKTFANLSANAGVGTGAWVNQSSQGAYRAEFLLHAAVLPARVQGVATVEARDGALHLGGLWQVQVPHGAATSFSITAPASLDGQWKLQGPPDISIRPKTVQAGDQFWEIGIPAGAPRRFALKLSAERPRGALLPIESPPFRLEGAVWADRWVVASGPGLEAKSATGLAPLKNLSTDAGPLMEVIERVASALRVWKVVADDWKLFLQLRKQVEGPDERVLLEEHDIAFGDGFGWVHQSSYLIAVKDAVQWTVTMPPGAVPLTAYVDGEQVNPRFAGNDRLAVPVPTGGRELHRLMLRWALERDVEPLTEPALVAPRLDVASVRPIHWTLTVPLGYRLNGPDSILDKAQGLGAAEQEIDRAEVESSVLEMLAGRKPQSAEDRRKLEDETASSRFRSLLDSRLAWVHLNPPSDGAAAGQVEKLKDRLAKLRAKNALLDLGNAVFFSSEAAHRETVAADLHSVDWRPQRGLVWRWQSPAGTPIAKAELMEIASLAVGADWRDTGWLLLLLTGFWLLPLFPRGTNRLKPFWPEQIALATFVLTVIWGLTFPALLLWTGAVLCRAYLFMPSRQLGA
jgi:hypothetical protein